MQLSLGEENAARDALRAAVVDAVRLITPKELCFRLGITASYLSEALAGKNSKGFRLDWLTTVIEMAPIDAVTPILKALCEIRGFDFERRKKRTPEEENREMRAILKREAPGVLSIVDKELGK